MTLSEGLVSLLENPSVVSFLSAFFGVLLAFGLTLWYDRRKSRIEERMGKTRVLKAIQLETADNSKTIIAFKKSQDFELLRTAAFESSVSSGFLSHFSSKVQDNLSKVYLAIHFHNKLLEMLGLLTGFSLTLPGADIDKAKALYQKLNEGAEHLLNELPKVLTCLDSESKAITDSRWHWVRRLKGRTQVPKSEASDRTIRGSKAELGIESKESHDLF